MAGVDGRVTLVTGAGRGIGRQAAEMLDARGAKVMCTARSEEELASTGLPYVVADLGTLSGCENAVEETGQRLGPVEILVCIHGLGSAHERVGTDRRNLARHDAHQPGRAVLPDPPRDGVHGRT